MNRISQLLRDPLVHFLGAGLLMFLIFDLVSPDKGELDPKTVIVDRAAMLIHVQNKLKMFDPKIAAAKLDGMSEEEREALVKDYIREEVMFREASSLGLDKEDYVMRRRVIQKLDFILDDIIEQSVSVDDDALKQYFEENKETYYVEPIVTLTHIFFDAEKHSPDDLLKLADEKKEELTKKQVIFSDAVKHGDRFHYHLNYVEKTYDFILSHFGEKIAGKVFSLTPSEENWYGPFQSQYGLHLVMISKRKKGRYSTLAEVKARVEMDYRRNEEMNRRDETVKRIIDTYNVQINL